MFKAKKKLFKMGWKQEPSGRMDCITKDFEGGLSVWTIWAGNGLMIHVYRTAEGHAADNIPFEDEKRTFKQARAELIPVFEGIIIRNKKRWDGEIKEYEVQMRKQGYPTFVFQRSERYGV